MRGIWNLIRMNLLKTRAVAVWGAAYLLGCVLLSTGSRGSWILLQLPVFWWVMAPLDPGSDFLAARLPVSRFQAVTAQFLYNLLGIGVATALFAVWMSWLGKTGTDGYSAASLFFFYACLGTAAGMAAYYMRGAAQGRFQPLTVLLIVYVCMALMAGSSGGMEWVEYGDWFWYPVGLVLLALSYYFCLVVYGGKELDAASLSEG